MPKKKAAPTSTSTRSTDGRTPSTSKVNKQDAAVEKPISEPDQKLTNESSPRNSNASNQRRKGSIAALLNDESIPKRRTSARLNPSTTSNTPNVTTGQTQDEPTIPSLIQNEPITLEINTPFIKTQECVDSPLLIQSDNNAKSLLQSTTPEMIAKAEEKKEEGNTHFRFDRYTEAIKLYSEAIQLNGDNPTYLANRAAASMALKDYQSALNDMETANSSKFIKLGIQPSIKNSIRLIRCLLPLGKFYQARITINQLLKEYPDSNQIMKEESRLNTLELRLNSIQRNRREQSWSMVLLGLVSLERELDCGPLKVKDWLLWKVEALSGQKKWEDANSLCSDLVRSYPSDPEVLHFRAKLKYSQGDLPGTVRHCQEAMRFDPDFTSALTLLRQARKIEGLKEMGNKSYKEKDYKSAIEKYEEASLIDGKNETILMILECNRAQALLKSGKNKQAIQACNKILNLDSNHFKALRTRGRAKKILELDLDSALVDLDSASKLAPSSKEKNELLADIKAIKVLIMRAKYVDHYKVLGISRNATDDEIKKAFHKKSLIHHPDKGGNEEKFKEVNEAYRILQDPMARRKYDRTNPDDPEGMGMFNGRSSGADYTYSNMEDLFRTSWSKNPQFGHPHHSHQHGFQSTSSFFSSKSGF